MVRGVSKRSDESSGFVWGAAYSAVAFSGMLVTFVGYIFHNGLFRVMY